MMLSLIKTSHNPKDFSGNLQLIDFRFVFIVNI